MSKENSSLIIDKNLVHRLISIQFPQWKELPISPVKVGGWDNRTFHLGKEMLVRMPSAAIYANQVKKEQQWLPRLAPFLPLKIPRPLAMGKPGEGYPWDWSIYRWLEGNSASTSKITDMNDFATALAEFLIAFESIDATGGPLPGPENFYRGGALAFYDGETCDILVTLKDKIDTKTVTAVWEEALATTWHDSPVWIHGDISPDNLLVEEGRLTAVIDFGQLAIGDPACDLSITWTFFKGESREVFRTLLKFDSSIWARARGWTLWKALNVAAKLFNSNDVEFEKQLHIIEEVIKECKK